MSLGLIFVVCEKFVCFVEATEPQKYSFIVRRQRPSIYSLVECVNGLDKSPGSPLKTHATLLNFVLALGVGGLSAPHSIAAAIQR
jgi:hypothetical protein